MNQISRWAREKLSGVRSYFERPDTSWLYLYLLRLYYWIQLTVAKKAAGLRLLAAVLTASELRLLDPDLFQVGEDQEKDKVVNYAVYILLAMPIDDATQLDEKQKESADALVARARKTQAVKNALADHFLAKAYLASAVKKTTEAEEALTVARAFVPSSGPLDAQAVYSRYDAIKKRLAWVRRQVTERSAYKFDFDVGTVVSLLAIASSLFLLTGYFYSRTLLGAFGIDVSLFFSIGDYLAASIEHIRYAAISALIGVLAMIIGLRRASLRSRFEIEHQRKKRERIDRIVFVLWLAASAKVAWDLREGRVEHNQLLIVALFLAMYVSDWFATRFFRDRLMAFVLSATVLSFAVYAFVDLQKTVSELRLHRWEGRDKLQISEVVGSDLVANDLVVIAATASDFFVLSKSQPRSYVLPRESVRFSPILYESTQTKPDS